MLKSGVALAAAAAGAAVVAEGLGGAGSHNSGSESPAAAVASLLKAATGQAQELVRSTFKPHVGSTFHMSQDGRSRRAVLAEVNDLSAATDDERQFSLVFTTAPGGGASQGLFGFNHSHVGTMALFAVPGARTATAQRYQVVVNRHRP
jgi:hypothetical protein